MRTGEEYNDKDPTSHQKDLSENLITVIREDSNETRTYQLHNVSAEISVMWNHLPDKGNRKEWDR